jgi:3-(3-hydroxy-phenyl)propionate hydroxylase
VRTGAGRIVLLDELLGDGFALVALDVDPLAALPSPLRERWGRLGTAVLRVTPPGARAAPMPPAHAEDLTGALTAWFRRHGGCVAVVRPDRYVAALCEGRGAPGLAETLAALTGGVLRRPDGPTA